MQLEVQLPPEPAAPKAGGLNALPIPSVASAHKMCRPGIRLGRLACQQAVQGLTFTKLLGPCAGTACLCYVWC